MQTPRKVDNIISISVKYSAIYASVRQVQGKYQFRFELHYDLYTVRSQLTVCGGKGERKITISM